jgi:hypothetical protein
MLGEVSCSVGTSDYWLLEDACKVLSHILSKFGKSAYN